MIFAITDQPKVGTKSGVSLQLSGGLDPAQVFSPVQDYLPLISLSKCVPLPFFCW